MSVEPFATPEPSREDQWRAAANKAAAIEATRPAWAQAVIVAELEQSECDSMSDYYATSTKRIVVLAWSRHTRDLFPELRHAAASFPETAHMGPDCDDYRVRVVLGANVISNGRAYHKGESSHWHSELFEDAERYGQGKHFDRLSDATAFIASAPPPEPIEFQTETGPQVVSFEWAISRQSLEHREKYSMGHGYYLSDAGTYGTGWRVRKTSKVDGHLHLENRIGMANGRPPVTPEPAYTTAAGIVASLNAERQGVELRFPAKPEDAVRDRLKAAGWRWSRFSSCWYQRDSPEARAFAADLVGVATLS